MAKFLFTMLPANDLGPPTRLVPIARALADRGHEVAVFNPFGGDAVGEAAKTAASDRLTASGRAARLRRSR